MTIEALQEYCLQLKATTEDIKWGNDLCFSVGGKMYCVANTDQPFTIAFKVKDEEFEELIQQKHIIPAPYMARAKWILVQQPSIFKKKECHYYLQQSYELVKMKLTKKIKQELEIN